MAITIAPTLPLPSNPYPQEKTEKEDKKAPDKKKSQKQAGQTSQDSPMSHNDRANLPTDQGLDDHQMGPSTDSDINTVTP